MIQPWAFGVGALTPRPYTTRELLTLLLLLLSHVSRVRLYVTPETAGHQAPVPGILQASILEWVAISFSSAGKWKVKVKLLSRVQLFANPWTVAYQALASVGFPRQEYWSGLPLPSLAYVCMYVHITGSWDYDDWEVRTRRVNGRVSILVQVQSRRKLASQLKGREF